MVGVVEAERFYGFTLTEGGRGFAIRSGLLNEMNQAVPRDRAQASAHAVTRRGLLRRRTDIVPHGTVQSLRVTQAPWQRALGSGGPPSRHRRHPYPRPRRPRNRDEAERLAWGSRRAAPTESERP